MIGGKPAKADDGSNVLGNANADDGVTGPNVPPHQNAATVNSGVTAYFGDARGGDGGDGGTVATIQCIGGPPPFCVPTPTVDGGDGGDGGPGGTVDITNSGDLRTTGTESYGMNADASGGKGGNGGWAADFFLTDGGAGGNGGNGGSARAVATTVSQIRTTGNSAHGILVNASGGNGGDGGVGGSFGSGDGGEGGRGGSGGTAYGENQGFIETRGDFARGLFVRAAGGVGGGGASGGGLIIGDGGNGGLPTVGGDATGVNSGDIFTYGNFAGGMVVQSVGGGGGDGGSGFGAWGGGGSGADGNDGKSATGTNTGNITTHGLAAIGMLVESVGGGGGDGGNAIGVVSVGGSGGGGGNAGAATANLGGSVTTGGDGAHGVLVQSVGGGGGNGGFALSINPTSVSVSIGGSGGTAGEGRAVNVNQSTGAGPTVATSGRSAIGILAQSVGGGGGNGGGAFAAAGIASVAIGGSGSRGGDGGEVRYNVGNATVTTVGADSAGVVAQSVGGGGGNGGFAISGSLGVAVGVGGSGSAGGSAKLVDVTSGGSIKTGGDRSAGLIAQSIGGGGGNGGFSIAGSLGAAIGVGGSGALGSDGGQVFFRTVADGLQNIETHGTDSAGLIVQSIGGGGGNGGFSGTVGVAAAVSVGGDGAGGGKSMAADATFNGTVDTFQDRSAGIIVQSVGGGGGNGGGAFTGSFAVAVGIGGNGGVGGATSTAKYTSNTTTITTRGNDSAGLIVQSIGGGGGNGGFSVNISAGVAVGVGGNSSKGSNGERVDVDVGTATIVTGGDRAIGVLAQSVGGGGGSGGFTLAGSLAVSVGIGGKGAGGGNGGEVVATIHGGSISTSGEYSHAFVAQSIGGGGGSGGSTIAAGLGVNVGVGGSGSVGGIGLNVTASNGAELKTDGIFSHGFLAQSVGGGGGSGGFSIAAGLGPAVSVAGSGDGGGSGGEVRATNTNNITTLKYGSIGLFAQSVGGGGGDGGFSYAVGTTAAVSVGGGGGKGGDGKLVDVTNNANIRTYGGLSHGILAQSVGGGGGNGGASNSVSAGLAAISVSIGGGGGGGGVGGNVIVRHTGDITVSGGGAKGIFAQSVGGNGGSGGDAFALAAAANVYPYPAGALSVSVGGSGGAGGNAGTVEVDGNGHIASIPNPAVVGDDGKPINPDNSGGILAQSVGGRGGDGGRSRTYSGSFSPTVSINLGASVGGKGGGGGGGNTVTVNYGLSDPTSSIVTTGNNSHGILAQSVGGGGGNGGDSMAGAGGLGGSVTVNATVTVGGWGGSGNTGGTVNVTNAATITTGGNTSNAILAQSIGGGGGSGGSASGTTASINSGSNVNVNANVAIGGQGGDGNNGGAVTVINSGVLETYGDFSNGILAQSIGGGGGAGGSADAKALNLGSSEGTTVDANLAIGGGGGDANGDRDGDGVTNGAEWGTYALGVDAGSSGMKVKVDNSGNIHTRGYGSAGIVAQSVGGGGGVAGAAAAGSEGKYGGSATVSVGAGIGLAGGDAGNGGEIEVKNAVKIQTDGDESNGVTASSVGGGGGIGGAASSGVEAEYAIGGSVGGFGGAAGIGGFVHVTNTDTAEIRTLGNRSVGIFAQSIGGSGGAGGGGESRGSGDTLTVNLVVGGFADGGGRGGDVIVENSGIITTGTLDLLTGARTGHGSHGIQAQSIGGGGGSGGAAGTTSEEAEYQIAASLSGKGGKGGKGGDVTVTNNARGVITTAGDNADGIFAQSVGGGGGSAGAGNSQAKGGDTTVTVQLGGTGAGGSDGGTVRVTNYGDITTLGVMSHGIFAQSIGGGGGASSSLTQASDGKTAIGIQLAPEDLLPGPNKVVGAGADGGAVYVHHNAGTINTSGAGAIGIFAQSVGGGGGFGGSMTNASAGDGSYSLQVGVNGGFGGKGGYVEVLVAGDIHTTGALAHGVVAQSVGGGGGMGADASGKAAVSLGVGGLGGAGGDGGNVYVERTGTIVTEGTDSIAIVAQSVGGGGGIGGTSFGRFATSDDGDGPDGLTLEMLDGSKGVGGTVTVIQTGEIETSGLRSHGIVAQAVGGGGGIAGGLNKGAGSAGGIGDANAAAATANSQIAVLGAESYALFGQSATGQGNSSAVTLTAESNLFAQGADSVAVYGESTAKGGKGNITINLNGQYTIGGAGTGVAAMLVGGANNTLTNHSLLYAMGANPTFDIQASQLQAFQAFLLAPGPVVPTNAILESLLDDFSPLAITGTSGDDHVKNSPTADTLGRVIGNIDLGGGNNSFENFADSSMVALKTIDLGGGLFTNDGLYTNQGIGVVAKVDVGGGFTQDASGNFVTDIDLNNQITDAVALTGAGDFDGTAPLNFLSIDKLFTAYTLAQGSAMADSGIVAKTLHPAAGFNFIFQVENGTDLVLTTDNDTFLELAQDPQSGVNDPGVFQLAQYLDDIEAASTPDNPMARLINLVRFLPSKAEIGAALTRLTPHYAVHTFDMINRETDIMLETARECTGVPAYKNPDGRCVWATISPQAEYTRDAGAGTTTRDDVLKTMSLGGIGEVGQNWSLGGTIGRTEFDSRIGFNGEPLSQTSGEAWQAYALAKYADKNYFVDFALGGGTGSFKGERDTHIDPAFFVPGETLEGIYLDEEMLPGIGNSVTYTQKTAQFGGSARLGFTQQMGAFYLQPTLQFDARWLRVSGKEEGSVAGFNFDGSANTFYAATPALEIGTDIPLSDIASIRLYGKAGVEFSTKEWEIEGRFAAAENLPGNPALHLTEAIDSPLYRVGAGLELNGVNGVGMSVRYNGAFGETVKQNAVSASLKVSF
ncbi:autotransporter outer membrane beta-barrel domain-containing protein [Mesorhizobium sp. ES1-6]|uniref:autotransporter outer membrane beta-barrel domain-containing protein n=1 Tax=Mesorhizobium sp. ES1-6 TaxID=2876626 RepID=UPI0021E2770C|nr:autotransporter outer membrane beta-barrel domain-containing protein [Mesorhizobium sp. ES1-6]